MLSAFCVSALDPYSAGFITKNLLEMIKEESESEGGMFPWDGHSIGQALSQNQVSSFPVAPAGCRSGGMRQSFTLIFIKLLWVDLLRSAQREGANQPCQAAAGRVPWEAWLEKSWWLWRSERIVKGLGNTYSWPSLQRSLPFKWA